MGFKLVCYTDLQKKEEVSEKTHIHMKQTFSISFLAKLSTKITFRQPKKIHPRSMFFWDQYFGTECMLHCQTTQKTVKLHKISKKWKTIDFDDLLQRKTRKNHLTWETFYRPYKVRPTFDKKQAKSRPPWWRKMSEKRENCALSQNFPPALRRKKTAIKLLTHHRFYLTTDIYKRAIQTNQCTCSLCRCWHCWQTWNFSN